MFSYNLEYSNEQNVARLGLIKAAKFGRDLCNSKVQAGALKMERR